jgi:plasmid maintenance system antidote protein VapI
MSTIANQEKFSITAKKRLLERRMTITALARKLGFARNTVSMAINHPILPTVRERVAKHLNIEAQ